MRHSWRRTRTLSLSAVALLAASCRDAVAPLPHGDEPLRFQAVHTSAAAITSGLTLNQTNATLNESGTMLIKGFNPTNPHHGDAIVATFIWVGSSNVITAVNDVLTSNGYPVVGNQYTLVEYVTSGGISMATYVALNVQNFPDPNDPLTGVVLAVKADLSQAVTDGGVIISSYSGGRVQVGPHRSAFGSGTTTTTADIGAVAAAANSLTYAVTLGDGLVGVGGPTGFTFVNNSSDATMRGDAYYLSPTPAGPVDPVFTWFFNSSTAKNWLGSAVSLAPAATTLAFTVQPSNTLPTQTISPGVQVTARDDWGNPVSGYNGPVTIAIGTNGGLVIAGTLSGTKTVNAVNGVATFSDLSIDQLGNGYTLVVTATGLSRATSAAFNIGPI